MHFSGKWINFKTVALYQANIAHVVRSNAFLGFASHSDDPFYPWLSVLSVIFESLTFINTSLELSS